MDINEKVKAIIADVLDMDAADVTEDKTFKDDLGADSLDQLQIVMDMEDAFDIEIPEEAAMDIQTVGDAIEQLQKALA